MASSLEVKINRLENLSDQASEFNVTKPQEISISSNNAIARLFSLNIINQKWEVNKLPNQDIFIKSNLQKFQIFYNVYDTYDTLQCKYCFYIGQTQVIPYKDEATKLFYIRIKNNNEILMQQSKLGAKYVLGTNPICPSFYPLYLEDNALQVTHITISVNESNIIVESCNQSVVWVSCDKIAVPDNSTALFRVGLDYFISLKLKQSQLYQKSEYIHSVYSKDIIEFAKLKIGNEDECINFLYNKFNPTNHADETINHLQESTQTDLPRHLILLIYQYCSPNEARMAQMLVTE